FYSDAARTIEVTSSVITSGTLQRTGGAGAQVLSFQPGANLSGLFYARLTVRDLELNATVRDFTLNLTPVADAPNTSAPATQARSFSAGPIVLSFWAALADASETLQTLTLSGVASGVTIDNATDLGGGVWNLLGLSAAQLNALTFRAAAGFATDMTLT